MSDISVSIETLALDGSEAGPDGGQRLAMLTGAALQRLFEQQGGPSPIAARDVGEIVAPSINLPAYASDEQKAQELALALFRLLDGMR